MEKLNELLPQIGYSSNNQFDYKPHPSLYHRNKRIEGFLTWLSQNLSIENALPKDYEIYNNKDSILNGNNKEVCKEIF